MGAHTQIGHGIICSTSGQPLSFDSQSERELKTGSQCSPLHAVPKGVNKEKILALSPPQDLALFSGIHWSFNRSSLHFPRKTHYQSPEMPSCLNQESTWKKKNSIVVKLPGIFKELKAAFAFRRKLSEKNCRKMVYPFANVQYVLLLSINTVQLWVLIWNVQRK